MRKRCGIAEVSVERDCVALESFDIDCESHRAVSLVEDREGGRSIEFRLLATLCVVLDRRLTRNQKVQFVIDEPISGS